MLVLDLEHLDAAATPQLLDEQMRQTGCFLVVGHNVPQHLIDDCFEFSRRLYDELSEEERRRYYWGATAAKCGYAPKGEASRDNYPGRPSVADEPNDNKAYFVRFQSHQSFGNVWPDETPGAHSCSLSGFRAAIEEYVSLTTGVFRELLPLLATALGQPADLFSRDSGMDVPLSIRMNYFSPGGAVRMGKHAHTDSVFCTLVRRLPCMPPARFACRPSRRLRHSRSN